MLLMFISLDILLELIWPAILGKNCSVWAKLLVFSRNKHYLKISGRITGLDPAGPAFSFPTSWYVEYPNELEKVHLWHSDAQFVDVIHRYVKCKIN